mmetsp:Transcript_11841/g.26560  ORF Transcript_11841/g.26560 Transcript_11841/m.26560 type:complete len:102 (+) Transcript_11841:389-694(+)
MDSWTSRYFARSEKISPGIDDGRESPEEGRAKEVCKKKKKRTKSKRNSMCTMHAHMEKGYIKRLHKLPTWKEAMSLCDRAHYPTVPYSPLSMWAFVYLGKH